MNTIIAWMSAHPIMTWVIIGFDVVVSLVIIIWLAIWLLANLFVLLRLGEPKDRSGADLNCDVFTITHDESSDEVVFNWTLTNEGNFAARQLHTRLSLRLVQRHGLTVIWRLKKDFAAVPAGDSVSVALRISRSQLNRMASDFEEGSIGIWTMYSPARATKPSSHEIVGPRKRFKLTVGEIGKQDCVTVTDLTPVDFYSLREPIW